MRIKVKRILRNTILALALLVGQLFPSSGIIKECDNDYEDSDDIQMFI